MKAIALLQPAYPYGKQQTYMGGALVALGAQLMDAGCQVDLFDLNIQGFQSTWSQLRKADAIGITVIGSPYIPEVIKLARELTRIPVPVLIGGQVIAKLGTEEFNFLFVGTHALQIRNDVELAKALELKPLRSPWGLSLVPMWNTMAVGILYRYLRHEMTLVFSQGCHFQCAFCAAEKRQRETFKDCGVLERDLRYLLDKAILWGIDKLEFYSTSLDFFQNPLELKKRLEMIARLREETGIKIRIRCLGCMSSFMEAYKEIPDLKDLLERAGVWCVGFGIDGLDSLVWVAQKKRQNENLEQVWRCLTLAEEMGLQAEALLVMGFPQERLWMMLKYLQFAFLASFRHKNIVLRPYRAKPQVPGNDYWGKDDPSRVFVREPQTFQNLDFCAIASPLVDGAFWHRLWANTIYLLICGIFGPLGKCSTSPLMPIGTNHLWNKFARRWNEAVPFDR